PEWMSWDSKTRSFHATAEAYRIGLKTDARKQSDAVSLSRYLALIGAPHIGTDASPGRTIWSAFPELAVPSPRVFALLSEAIRLQRLLQITYRSMREPSPHQHTVSPHSLVRAGRRW